MTKRLAKGLKITAGILAGALMAGGGFGVLHFWDYPVEALRLGARLDTARRMGIPTSFAELNIPNVPEQENAWPEIKRALDEMKSIGAASDAAQRDKKNHEDDYPSWGAGSDLSLAKDLLKFNRHDLVAVLMAEYDPAISRLVEATRKPGFRANAVLGDDGFVNWDTTKLTTLNRLLLLRATMRAHAGQNDLAAADLGASANLATLLARDASTESIAQGGFCEGHRLLYGMNLLRVLYKQRKQVPEVLLTALETRATVDSEWAMRVAIVEHLHYARNFKRHGGIDAFNCYGPDPFDESVPFNASDIPYDVTSRGVFSRALGYWTEFLRASPEPWKDPLRAQAISDSLTANDGLVSDVRLTTWAIQYGHFSALGGLGWFSTHLRQAQTADAIKVIRFKQKHGNWPPTLAAAGGTGIDPYSGEPFRYKKSELGFRIWSIGRDRISGERGMEIDPDEWAYPPLAPGEKRPYCDDIELTFPYVKPKRYPPLSKKKEPWNELQKLRINALRRKVKSQ